MVNIVSTARPYAKAAFQAAKNEHQTAAWSTALRELSCITQHAEMQSILKNPGYSKQQLSELFIGFLHASSNKAAATHQKSIENFIRLLSEKKRLNTIPAISLLFEEDVASEANYLSLIVTSAFELSDAEQSGLTKKLSTQFNSKLNIDFRVDKTVIGGLLVRSGNWVLDSTIQGQLKRLKSALI